MLESGMVLKDMKDNAAIELFSVNEDGFWVVGRSDNSGEIISTRVITSRINSGRYEFTPLVLIPNPCKCENAEGYNGECFICLNGKWEACSCIYAETPEEAKELARIEAKEIIYERWGIRI